MWDDGVHITSELDFYKIRDANKLKEMRKNFNWRDYRLFISNDYGFAESGAWACGFYAQDRYTNDIYKIYEMVESGLTISVQRDKTLETIEDVFGWKKTDIDNIFGDPKSYFQKRESYKGTDFYTFKDVYAEKGLEIEPSNNDRIMGAGMMLEALRIREDGTSQLRFLDNCTDSIETISALPVSPHKPEDVDTDAFDHCYDETRYCIVMLTDPIEGVHKEVSVKRESLLEIFKRTGMMQGNSENNYWRCG